MTSARRLAANRANAQKSTGPKTARGKAIVAANGNRSHGPVTAAGKARSRWNALKHGILAQSVIPCPLELYESAGDFAAFYQDLRADLDPQTMLEEMLVETIATCHWRLGRVLRTEGASIAGRQADVQQDFESALKLEELRTVGEPPPDRPALTSAPLPGTPHAHSHRLAIMQSQRASPPLGDALAYARYEAHFQRQLHRALAALERAQRRRLGDAVAPPPIDPSLDPPL